MATYYFDANATGPSYLGTTDDPWGPTQLMSESAPSDVNFVLLRGIATIDFDATKNYSLFNGGVYPQSPVFEKWGSDPWRIKFVLTNVTTPITPFIKISFRNGYLFLSGFGPSNSYFQLGYSADYGSYIDMTFIDDSSSICSFASYYTGGAFPTDLAGCTVVSNGIMRVGNNTGACAYVDCKIQVAGFNVIGTAGITKCAVTCLNPLNIIFSVSDCQFNWVPPTWPAWDADKTLWAINLLAGPDGIDTPPEPGSAPDYKWGPGYFYWNTDAWGNARTGIGADYMIPTPTTTPAPTTTTPAPTTTTTTTTSAPGPVVANFIASPQEGYSPLAVQFTSTSTGGPIIYYKWHFGDGNIAEGDPNPLHVYKTPDIYSVILEISGNVNSDSIIKYEYVIVNEFSPPSENIIVESYDNDNDQNWKFFVDADLHLVFTIGENTYKSGLPVIDTGTWTLVEFHPGQNRMYVSTVDNGRKRVPCFKIFTGDVETFVGKKILVAENTSMKIDELRVLKKEVDLTDYFRELRGHVFYLR